jgi:hypothetical protein
VSDEANAIHRRLGFTLDLKATLTPKRTGIANKMKRTLLSSAWTTAFAALSFAGSNLAASPGGAQSPPATPAPTATPTQTAAPEPTATPAPTATPTQTATPAPTATPAQTATPVQTASPASAASPSPPAAPLPTIVPVLPKPDSKFIDSYTLTRPGADSPQGLTLRLRGDGLATLTTEFPGLAQTAAGTPVTPIDEVGTWIERRGLAVVHFSQVSNVVEGASPSPRAESVNLTFALKGCTLNIVADPAHLYGSQGLQFAKRHCT